MIDDVIMIEIENLYRTFHHDGNEVPVLKDINLNIKRVNALYSKV